MKVLDYKLITTYKYFISDLYDVAGALQRLSVFFIVFFHLS